MAKKLKYSEIADKDVLSPLIKEVEMLNTQLEKAAINMKELGKDSAKLAKSTPLDSFENIEKVEKGVQNTKKAVQELDAIEKEREKLQERLAKLNDARAQDLANIRQEITEQNKQLRDNAKAQAEANNAYKVLTKRTNEAQAEFKKLAAQFGVNSKEAKEAKKQFDELDEQLREVNDAAKDGRRDVGRYEKAWSGLNNTLGKLGVLALLLKLIEGISNAWSSNSEALNDTNKVLGRVTISFAVITNRIVKAIPIVKGLFTDFFNSIGGFFTKLGLQFDILMKKAEILFSNPFGGGIKVLEKELEVLEKRLESLNGQGSTSTLQQLIDNFKGIGDEITDLVEKNDKLIDTTAKYRKQIIGLEKELADLRREREKFNVITEDDSQSLENQIEAAQRVAEINDKIADREISIAAKRLEIARRNASVNKFNIEAQEELAMAYSEYVNTIAEAETIRAENLVRQRMILLDLFDENLDDLIDFADNSKTINERILTDDKRSFEERQRAYKEAIRNQELAFRAQIQLFEDTENELRRKRGEQADFALNVDDLLSIEDTVELNKRIKALNLTERQRIRLLELIREQRTVTQDLKESQNDLNDTERDTIELNREILLQEAALLELRQNRRGSTKTLEKLEKDLLELQIRNLRERIALLDENSIERLNLEKELNDLLLQEQDEKNKKALEKEKELAEKSLTVIREFLQKRNEERLKSIDDEISAVEKREERLAELAQQGIQNADENLALAQKRRAELEAQRAREIERQKKEELALTAIETYGQKVANGDKNPLASTITDIQLLRAFVQSLPTFYQGSERVGDDLDPFMSGKDGHLIRVDGDERILNPSHSRMIPKNMSNLELAMLAQGATQTQRMTEKDLYLLNLGKKMDNVATEIRNKPTYLGRDFDANRGAIIDLIEKKGKLERNHRKTGGIWGS